MTVAKKIRLLLIEKDMSIGELAEKINTSIANLSNKLKRDNFSEKEIKEIAEALDCNYEINFIKKEEDTI